MFDLEKIHPSKPIHDFTTHYQSHDTSYRLPMLAFPSFSFPHSACDLNSLPMLVMKLHFSKHFLLA